MLLELMLLPILTGATPYADAGTEIDALIVRYNLVYK